MFQVKVLKAWQNLILSLSASGSTCKAGWTEWDGDRERKRERMWVVWGEMNDTYPDSAGPGGDLATWWWCTTHWLVVYLCSSHPCSPHPPTSQTRSLGCTQIGSLTPLKPYRDDWEKTLQSGRQQGGLLPHHSGHSNAFFSWKFWGPHHAGT